MKYKEILDEYSIILSEQSENIKLSHSLSSGYISTKNISGNQYSYLQKRVDGKLTSKYIKKELLSKVKDELKKRDEVEKSIKQANKSLSRLEAAAKLLDNSLFHRMLIIKQCSLMDTLSAEERKKAVEFGNAIAAIEGIVVSDDTENALNSWVSGEHSFEYGYLQVLEKYNLIMN